MDIHILNGESGKLRMVCHLPIPAGNNSAGVSWQTALVNSGLGGTTVMPDGDGTAGTISAAEKAQIESGAIFEREVEILPDTAANNASRLAYVDATYAAVVASEMARLQAALKWYGFTRDVP